MFDLVFICDANNSIGFGHVNRCINLAKHLFKNNNKIKIGFLGSYVNEVKKRIRNNLNIKFIKKDDLVKSRCLVIDALGDDDDPNVFPTEKYKIAKYISENIIYLCSGTKTSKFPKDVICIGFQPSGITSKPPNIYWGLKYAPTLKIDYSYFKKRNKNKVLLALGGIKDISIVKVILEVLEKSHTFKRIDILWSPVNKNIFDEDIFKDSKIIKLHYDLKSISPLLFESSIVIATFGFLSYEALAHGAPLCSIATKKFQSDYGDLLEDRGLAYNVGLVNNNSKKKLSKLIKKTLDDADNLSIQAKKLMDGNGIKRLANIIENYCKYE